MTRSNGLIKAASLMQNIESLFFREMLRVRAGVSGNVWIISWSFYGNMENASLISSRLELRTPLNYTPDVNNT